MKKAYALLTVFLPVLAVYASPIPGFDLGTFIVLIFGLVCVTFANKTSKVKMPIALLLVLVYTAFSMVMAVVDTSGYSYSSTTSIILRTVRFIFMLVIMMGIGAPSYFDYELIEKYLRRLTLFVSVYAIIQLVFFDFTGLKLINVIGPTKVGVGFESQLGEYEVTYRPPSIFLEPSSVIYYILPYLSIALFASFSGNKFGERNKKQDFIDAVIITIGSLCTTSGQGIVAVTLVWSLWIVVSIFKKGYRKNLLISPIVIGVVLLLYFNGTFDFTLARIGIESDSMNAVDARVIGYTAFEQLSDLRKIVGTGYGNYREDIYYSSFADILFCTGYVGLILVLAMYIYLFIKGHTFQKILIVASFVIMLGGGIYTATYLCLYLPMLFCFPNGEHHSINKFNRRRKSNEFYSEKI